MTGSNSTKAHYGMMDLGPSIFQWVYRLGPDRTVARVFSSGEANTMPRDMVCGGLSKRQDWQPQVIHNNQTDTLCKGRMQMWNVVSGKSPIKLFALVIMRTYFVYWPVLQYI